MVSFSKAVSALTALLFVSTKGETDCSNPDNSRTPECFCINPINHDSDVCATLFDDLAAESDLPPAIVGGTPVPNNPNPYPWFAKTIYSGGSWSGCGGMLVAPQYALTAAHCAAIVYGVEVGAFCQSSGNCGEPSQKILMEGNIIVHPQYNGNTLENDFALVKLKTKVTDVTPVTLDSNNLSNSYGSGKKLWAIGLGATSSGGSSSNVLLHVEVGYSTNSQCDSAYANLYGSGSITSSMMCAADTNKDSCQGDSGGPLYDKQNGVLVGVVSWGYGCAVQGYPGVYARISDQYDWIKNTICGDNDSEKPDFCNENPTPTAPTAPTPTPPTPTPPTPTGGGCSDSPSNWVDSAGDGCDWYAEDDRCADYGNGFAGTGGNTANQACCVCGGGATDDEGPGDGDGSGCSDRLPDWVDSAGDGCDWYAEDASYNCAEYGDDYAGTGGYTAKQNCCVCGGGVTDDEGPGDGDGSGCQDSDEQFLVGTRLRTCRWAYVKATSKRCNKSVVSDNCPVTCGDATCTCADTEGSFSLPSGATKTCDWAGQRKWKRCKNYVVHANCPVTCGVC